MKIKYLILLNIIIVGINNWNINCSEQNQEIKLVKEEEILKLFQTKSGLWVYFECDAFYQIRLERLKQYIADGYDLSILVDKAIYHKDTALVKFLLEQDIYSSLFYKYIEPTELKGIKFGTIKYDLSNINIMNPEFTWIKEIFNLISYNKYLKENANNYWVSELLQVTPLPKELIQIIINYYITSYEEFCSKNQDLINRWREEFKQGFENDRKEREEQRRLKINNNKLISRCKKCIIQ